MKHDFTSYKFTNGTRVSDWLDTLPADDRKKAEKCVAEFIDNNQPLNMLKLKIRLTSYQEPDEFEVFNDDDDVKVKEPEVVAEEKDTDDTDFYHSREPLKPTYVEPEPHEHKVRHKHTIQIIILCIIALLLTAFLTNPQQSQHKQEMAKELTMAAQDAITDAFGQGAFGGIFGQMLKPMFGEIVIENAINYVLESGVEYHNYLFWSTCTCNIDNEKRIVSFGIFGMVFTFDKDAIIDTLKTQMQFF